MLVPFNVTTVASSPDGAGVILLCWVGSEEGLYAETKPLCLCDKLIFSAPPHQVLRPVGSRVLCIPLVHGSYPATMNC
jgi:hypothetical protein